MQNIHPPYRFRLGHPPQIGLSCLQILVPKDHFRDNLQWHPISTCLGGSVSAEIVGRKNHVQFFPQLPYQVMATAEKTFKLEL